MMSPLSTLRRIRPFSHRLHHSLLPAGFRAAVVHSCRQEPARGSDQRDHQTVAPERSAMHSYRSDDPISVVESNPFPCRWSDQPWTS
jgi:hypothetical protein